MINNLFFFFNKNVEPQRCHLSPTDGKVQFHMKSAIFHSQYLYQIVQLSNHILSQLLIWQKPTLPRSPVVLRPSDPVQARGRDTGSGTRGREGSSHECPAQQQPMSDEVWHTAAGGSMVRSVGPGVRQHDPITPLPFTSPACFLQLHPLHLQLALTRNWSI